MFVIEAVALGLTVAGSLLGVASGLTDRRRNAKTTRAGTGLQPRAVAANGRTVLAVFAAVVAVFGVLVIVTQWDRIVKSLDQVLLVVGLGLTMIAGMVVQVVSDNYRNSRPFASITASQLLYPMLFSPIVFYPIWMTVGPSTSVVFSFYAAFLNGYFWEATVTAAKRPASGGNEPDEPLDAPGPDTQPADARLAGSVTGSPND